MINSSDRDFSIIFHIEEHCEKINKVKKFFKNQERNFEREDLSIYRDVCAFYVSQIGELSTHISADFAEKFPDLPWRGMKGIRNVIVHTYGTIDNKILWDVIQKHIPPLQKRCNELLKENEKFFGETLKLEIGMKHRSKNQGLER